jgi:lactate dehydrogenase-like 2-hydroxyacid dehydrogenase
MSEPVVLISHEMLAPVQQLLDAQGFRVARRWDLTDADRAEVRVIVHAGEVVLTPDFLASLPKLGLVACVSVGYDGVDVAWCRANGIEVTHAKGLNAEDVADHALGLLIASWRNIVVGDRVVREGRWRNDDRMGPRPGLAGRKVGIVGLGAIGEAVARRVEACGMTVAWWGPNPKEAAWPRADSVLALAADSDVFADEPTPVERWEDVPGTVLTPHTAGGTVESIPRMVAQAIDNVRRFLAGEPVASPAAG